MASSVFLAILISAAVACVFASESSSEKEEISPAKEWGESIEWIEDTDDAIEAGEKQNKPIMLVVHRTWCGACKALAPKFKASAEIKTLAKDFIMGNIWGESEPWHEEYQVDGKYVPRILLLDKNGKLWKDIKNPENEKSYHYFYTDVNLIAKSMQKALERHNAGETVDGSASLAAPPLDASGKAEPPQADAKTESAETTTTTSADPEEKKSEEPKAKEKQASDKPKESEGEATKDKAPQVKETVNATDDKTVVKDEKATETTQSDEPKPELTPEKAAPIAHVEL